MFKSLIKKCFIFSSLKQAIKSDDDSDEEDDGFLQMKSKSKEEQVS